MRRLLAAAVPLTLLAAAPAVAQAPLSASFSPSQPGKAASLRVDVDGDQLDQSRVPNAIRLTAPAGTKFDADAVTASCTDAQAEQGACTNASQLGAGTATLDVSLLGPVEAQLAVHRAPARRSGDVAGLVVVAEAAGQTLVLAGRVLPGPVVVFEGLDGGGSLPPGITARLKRLTLAVKAERTEKVRKRKRIASRKGSRKKRYKTIVVTRTRTLLSTPKTCPAEGSWVARVSVSYPEGAPTDLIALLSCSASR